MEITGEKRREEILSELMSTDSPVTASALARHFSVSRQIVVGDVAILRAGGHNIIATPRGYLYERSNESAFTCIEPIVCKHNFEEMREELYTIVDYGATVIDVTVEHPIYGEIICPLNISSRFEVDIFMDKFSENQDATPISALTGGTHLHKIGAHDKDIIVRVQEALAKKGILVP